MTAIYYQAATILTQLALIAALAIGLYCLGTGVLVTLEKRLWHPWYERFLIGLAAAVSACAALAGAFWLIGLVSGGR